MTKTIRMYSITMIILEFQKTTYRVTKVMHPMYETSHYNDNFNSNRGETFEERFKCNSHFKPANTDEEVIPCDDDD